ncbi:hypothetical protein GIB67_019592 [Kingdonia uniflora]|uniref:CHCH domain-containing protein n=1 Tax=Kingdonia uniflora TaxID=39325 RepID=A0A7J7N0X7_9MAGN|nr:hypothetical protein GIB67_019592 [Kingdonia uniflora]
MARRSSGGRSAARAPAPRRAPVKNAPQPASHAPPPAPVQGGGGGSMLGNLGSTIMQGMAFGGGSAVAHRAVDAVMGPRTVQHETAVAEATGVQAPMTSGGGSDACGSHSKAFQDCLNNYGSDISKCQFYLDMLSECRRNGTMLKNDVLEKTGEVEPKRGFFSSALEGMGFGRKETVAVDCSTRAK